MKNSENLQSYAVEKRIGEGAFAIVFLATVQESGERVAIKKAPLDKKYKNRELANLKLIGDHPNIVSLKDAFYVVGQNEEVYINYVMEFLPENLSDYIKNLKKQKKQLTQIQLQCITYQLLRGLAFIHGKGMAHRDIKPQNILIDKMIVKYCDFGSSKIISGGQINTSYLCSRYYRAPELIFGATDYSINIDIWSLGCVFAELILLEPLFPGESSVDQLVEIMKVLGTPTAADIAEFNISNTDFKFPQVKGHPWSKVFLKYKPDPLFIDLIKKMVIYQPQQRIKPFMALMHPFFNDLRKIQNEEVPEILWQFTPEEENIFGKQPLKHLLPTRQQAQK
ncbi:unnamed protein product [Paramecium sonneborni]|uniref:Protein kinase domain-containing protein n=1 Tax=Paramecium sonneborni TaxID=65129 RepID=A0A8S1LGY9_9CILI|nr:unnamed protein product [Paramecium sonneborni]